MTVSLQADNAIAINIAIKIALLVQNRIPSSRIVLDTDHIVRQTDIFIFKREVTIGHGFMDEG